MSPSSTRGAWTGSASLPARSRRPSHVRVPLAIGPRGGVPHGADPLRMDLDGRTPPRLRPPCRDGRTLPLRSISRREPMGPGRDRRGLGLDPSDRSGAASTRPRKPACSPSPASRDASSRHPSSNVPNLGGRSVAPPLYGPIPWSWLLPAHPPPRRCPSTSRRRAGSRPDGSDRRNSSCRWANGPTWALSRQAAAAASIASESAGLVSVSARPGRSPIVLILRNDTLSRP